jgi:3-deoxy-D-manno-octulosonic-acid transferase
MQILYNILIALTSAVIPVIALFNFKMRLFYKGRKETFSKLKKNISSKDKTIWMHCASLGEFEQGRPVLEKLKKQYPDYKLILSFFSPSGYEVQKNYPIADAIVYLPLDTPANARKFLDAIHPNLSFFVKYEFWPNILSELKNRKLKTFLISGIFRKEQVFFKKNKIWFRDTLTAFTHFFVQNKTSQDLLKSIGLENVSLCGDTRFDRVTTLVKNKKDLPIIASFSNKQHVLVAGSTWAKDETILIDYINNKAQNNEKFIIAPHNIKKEDIDKLQSSLRVKSLLYSKANTDNIKDIQVLIIDSIGLLSSVYAYAKLAYVGGGFGAGIHNILEPATYAIPILIGPNYHKFKEAVDLIAINACFVIDSQEKLNLQLQTFYQDQALLLDTGTKSLQYIQKNIGATDCILNYKKTNDR